MKRKREKKIHIDRGGREYIKEYYFVGGKMKFFRIYVIDGIPADEFYKQNATDLDFHLNGDYHLMSSENISNNISDEKSKKQPDSVGDENFEDLPF